MSLTAAQQQTLLALAKEAIHHGLHHGRAPAVQPEEYEPALQAERASFVTLHLRGQLRGCIGALEASMPLATDVAQHAYAAAFSDPRFPAVTESEAQDLDIHISVLSPSTPVEFASEHDLLTQLRPGVDGLTITRQGRKATFLPTVWESLPRPREFLDHLKRKAGIPLDTQVEKAWRYTTEDVPSGA